MPRTRSKPVQPITPTQIQYTRKFYEKPMEMALLVLILTFFALSPVLKNGFINTWDDEKYVTSDPIIQAPGLSGVGAMFTHQVNGSYVPLPLLTFAIEYHLFGMNPVPFHVTNLLLHLLCTFLVFRLLLMFRLDLRMAAFGALLFGIHPMHVESVAWITERKDVLYGAFYLTSLLMYLKHLQTPRGNRYLLLCFLFFFLSLLSKIEAVTLPLVMLLFDYFENRKLQWRRVTEKWPFFLFSLLIGLIGIFIIYRVGIREAHFLKANETYGLADRFFYGLWALSGYLLKFLLPLNLSAFYPYTPFSGAGKLLFYLLNPLLLFALGWLIFRSKNKVIVFGFLFFLVCVFFLLQIFSVGVGYFADRYIYIPYFGLCFIVAWGAGRLFELHPRWRTNLIGVLSVWMIFLAASAFQRTLVWRDGVSLWSNVIGLYPDRHILPYANRGVAWLEAGQYDNALADFTTAISMDPASSEQYSNRGIVYGVTGQPQKAIDDLTIALNRDPKNVKARFNRGVAYSSLNQTKAAKHDFCEVIAKEHAYLSAYQNLGIILYRESRYDSAILVCRNGININPASGDLFTTLGNCLLEKGDLSAAVQHFHRGLELNENDLDGWLGLAATSFLQKDMERARSALSSARQTEPKLNYGSVGLEEVEKSGIFIGPQKRAAVMQLLGK